MGCDHQPADCHSRAGISIHASRMGCDDQGQTKLHQVADFNPRIPYGMRLGPCHIPPLLGVISIHASRMGCDPRDLFSSSSVLNFNPRIPYGMRLCADVRRLGRRDFNPRIPYGMRPHDGHSTVGGSIFQSTHPVWDATVRDVGAQPSGEISIHASRMGCDPSVRPSGLRKRFQSTHPVWDATGKSDARH